MTLFRHWTAAIRVPRIRETGVILATESNVHPTIGHAGPNVVWLLPPDQHPGHQTQHGLSPQKRDGWIDVDVPAIRWLDWTWTAEMDEDWKRALIKAAGGIQFAEQWYVFPADIRKSRFRRYSDEVQQA